MPHHVPLATVDINDGGERAVVNITCSADDGERFSVATMHLATVVHALIGACAALGIALDTPATVVWFASEDERRAAEATYAAAIRQRHHSDAKEK